MKRASRAMFAWLLAACFPTAFASTCSCACCHTAYRPPSMQILAAKTMCVVNIGPGRACDDQCQVGDMNTVSASTDNGLLETSRYCLMDCLPKSDQVGSDCAELSEGKVKRLMTEDGNGDDPAKLLAPPRRDLPQKLELDDEAARLAQATAATGGKPDQNAEMKEALRDLLGGDYYAQGGNVDWAAVSQLADAAGKRAYAAALDARSARVEAGTAISVTNSSSDLRQSLLNAKAANDAKAKLRSASVRAAIYAKTAIAAERQALAEVLEIRAAPKKIAQEAATWAVKTLKNSAGQLQSVSDDPALPTGPPPLTEAAARIQQPFQDAMQRTVAAQQNYQAEAHQLSDRARDLQTHAKSLAGQAVVYQSKGEAAVAKTMMEQANSMLNEAEAAGEKAHETYRMAEDLSKGVGTYDTYAKMAGARASVLTRQRWMPPAVPKLAGAPGPAPAPAAAPLATALLAKGRPRSPRKKVSGAGALEVAAAN